MTIKEIIEQFWAECLAQEKPDWLKIWAKQPIMQAPEMEYENRIP